MSTFAILDADNNELLELNGGAGVDEKSLTLTAENFSFENKIVENTFLAGSSKLGETRLMSREASLTLNRAYDSDSAYRAKVNELVQFLKAGTYLSDKENDLRIPYAVSSFGIAYDGGSFRRSSDDSINLIFLKPFWEAITEVSVGPFNIAASTITDEAFSNPGFIEVFPRIEVNASSAVTDMSFTIVETFNSINIQDSLFGTPGYEDIIINCEEGSVMLGLLDRINSVAEGTGFFPIPFGSSTIRFLADAAIDVTIYYRPRFYI